MHDLIGHDLVELRAAGFGGLAFFILAQLDLSNCSTTDSFKNKQKTI
ncbi:hypothetical protein DSUL_80076 [Desulfovibrionales bacterium]